MSIWHAHRKMTVLEYDLKKVSCSSSSYFYSVIVFIYDQKGPFFDTIIRKVPTLCSTEYYPCCRKATENSPLCIFEW